MINSGRGAASIIKEKDEACLDNVGLLDTGDEPTKPFTVSFNSGTLYRVPAQGSPYKVELRELDADLLVTGAGSAETYESGGVVRLDADGSGDPTRLEPS